jgi:hypothetical protein
VDHKEPEDMANSSARINRIKYPNSECYASEYQPSKTLAELMAGETVQRKLLIEAVVDEVTRTEVADVKESNPVVSS